ncbi:MAG: hypothetical protein C4520_01305, partial [Candidatus Abyssobacteria bacterium SURF_5]
PIAEFAYDLNGNLTSRTTAAGTTAMEYDYENRLVRITYPSNSGTTEFVYDALGRRLKTTEKDGLGQITGEMHYAYDGLDLIAELDASDSLIAGFTHGPEIDDPLIARYDGADYLYLKNHQGSVTELITFNGAIAKSYRYDAFGNIKQETTRRAWLHLHLARAPCPLRPLLLPRPLVLARPGPLHHHRPHRLSRGREFVCVRGK